MSQKCTSIIPFIPIFTIIYLCEDSPVDIFINHLFNFFLFASSGSTSLRPTPQPSPFNPPKQQQNINSNHINGGGGAAATAAASQSTGKSIPKSTTSGGGVTSGLNSSVSRGIARAIDSPDESPDEDMDAMRQVSVPELRNGSFYRVSQKNVPLFLKREPNIWIQHNKTNNFQEPFYGTVEQFLGHPVLR